MLRIIGVAAPLPRLQQVNRVSWRWHALRQTVEKRLNRVLRPGKTGRKKKLEEEK